MTALLQHRFNKVMYLGSKNTLSDQKVAQSWRQPSTLRIGVLREVQSKPNYNVIAVQFKSKLKPVPDVALN